MLAAKFHEEGYSVDKNIELAISYYTKAAAL
jgi:TPR repeat protein